MFAAAFYVAAFVKFLRGIHTTSTRLRRNSYPANRCRSPNERYQIHNCNDLPLTTKSRLRSYMRGLGRKDSPLLLRRGCRRGPAFWDHDMAIPVEINLVCE